MKYIINCFRKKNRACKIYISLSALFINLLLALSISYKVLPIYGGITYNDANYWYWWNSKFTFINFLTNYTPNYLGQIVYFINLPKAISIFILGLLGLNDYWISYLMSFGIIFLCSMIFFYVFWKISNNYFYGLLASIFIILNNHSIEYILIGGFYFYSGAIAIALLFLILWKIYQVRELKLTYLLLIVLSSLFISHPFYFVIYFIFLFSFFIFFILVNRLSKKNILFCLFTIVLLLLIHFYWLLPLIDIFINQSPEQIRFGGNLEAVFQGFLNVASYINYINFFMYPGFSIKHFHQNIFHYIFYIGIILLILSSLFIIKKHRYKNLLFFSIISIITFFNLSLGPVSTLTGKVWLFLWDNISLFSFFRSFSRFLMIIIPLYLFYFAIFNLDWKYKYKNYFYIIFIIIVLALNVSVFSGDLKGKILATKIPNEYKFINEYFISDKKETNIIAFPNQTYELYKWGLNKDTSSGAQDYYLKDYLFTKPIIYNRIALMLDKRNKLFEELFSTNINTNNLEENLKKINVGYVLIQKDLLEYSNLSPLTFDKYDDLFKSNKNFVLLEDNEYFNLYKYKNVTGILAGKNLYFQKINPAKYRLFIKNLKGNMDLSFLQNYHNEWKLYIKRDPDNSWCKPLIRYDDTETTECYHAPMFYQGEELKYLLVKPVFESEHKTIYNYANGWIINSEYIKENYPQTYYKKNPDGSIDIEMVLFFKTQSFFYLGLMISGTVILASIIYIIYKRFSKRSKIY
jgi:hypothetical protein